MSILKLRDENGVFQDVPVLKGTDATINGQSTVQIQAGQNVNIDQSNGILTISAIGGGGGSVDDIVVLDLEKICSLTTESTPEEITTALGGEENKQNVIKAYENNNNIVLKGFFRTDLGSSVAINSFYANISVEIITSFAGGANYILCLIFNDSHFKNVIKFKLNETIDDIISFEEREQYNIPTNISDLENDSNFISGVASPTNLGGIKVGNNLTIDSDGKLNAVGGGGSGVETIEINLLNLLQLTPESTHDDIVQAFGGAEQLQKIMNVYTNKLNIVMAADLVDYGNAYFDVGYSTEIDNGKHLMFLSGNIYGMFLTLTFITNNSFDDIVSFKNYKIVPVPTKISQLTNDSNFIKAYRISSDVSYFIKSSSTNEEVIRYFGGEDKFNGFVEACKAGKVITTESNGVQDVDVIKYRYNNMVNSIELWVKRPSPNTNLQPGSNIDYSWINVYFDLSLNNKGTDNQMITDYEEEKLLVDLPGYNKNGNKKLVFEEGKIKWVDNSNVVTKDDIASTTNLGLVKVGNNLTIDSDGTLNAVGGGGEGGTTDYTALSNKPQINNVTLSGNKSLDDLGIQQKGTYLETESDPTVPAHVKTITSTQITNWDNEVGAKSIANGKQDILTPGSNINISNGVISATDTTNYSLLTNKPKINNKELSGNMTLDTLGIQEKGTYLESESDPTVPSYVKSITSDQITKWDNEVGGKAIAANKQDALTPGTNISIENNVISAVDTNTTNYTELTNKPKINSVELSGNKTLDDLSIQHKLTAGTNIDITGNTISTSVQNGKDGHTPVKGVDYFTAEEQEQFKNDIINSIGAVQTYRTGNGIPANSLGQDGDLYFDMQ